MIAATYALSGILLALSASMFQQGMLTAQTQSLAWIVIFFFASSAASAAYLTVSELFPLELRGIAYRRRQTPYPRTAFQLLDQPGA